MEILSRRGPTAACTEILELVLARGAPDNASLIAVACQQATALSFLANP
jgi:serine/threonine protein phosphatase PrpC